MDLIQPAVIRENCVLAIVTWYNSDGDAHHTTTFKAGKVGKNAHVVNHPDHKALLERVVDYFGLTRPIDYRTSNPDHVPETIADINHPVIYTPTVTVYGDPENVWTIRFVQHRAKNPNGTENSTWAYLEDDGEFANQVRETRRTIMANTAAAKRGTKPESEKQPRVARGPVVKSIKDMPLETKPNRFEVNGEEMQVKVFGKIHREKMGPEGKRIPDPETPRTAKDDVFTYAATAYQLGKVKSVAWAGTKGLLIVGENGVGILQSIRKSDKEEVAALKEKLTEKGFKGDFSDAK